MCCWGKGCMYISCGGVSRLKLICGGCNFFFVLLGLLLVFFVCVWWFELVGWVFYWVVRFIGEI